MALQPPHVMPAGVYASQSRDDFSADDVEHYFNYMGMLATEVGPMLVWRCLAWYTPRHCKEWASPLDRRELCEEGCK